MAWLRKMNIMKFCGSTTPRDVEHISKSHNKNVVYYNYKYRKYKFNNIRGTKTV